MGKGREQRTYSYAKKIEEKKTIKKVKRKQLKKEKDVIAQGAPHVLLHPKKVPKTIDSMRVENITRVAEDDEEVKRDLEGDESANVLTLSSTSAEAKNCNVKVLITTSQQTVGEMTYQFVQEMLNIVPNAEYYSRRNYKVKDIISFAIVRDFTSVIVIAEDKKKPVSLSIIHLPEGPTALFKLSNYLPSKHISGHGRATEHYPELILNQFTTRLGYRVGRMLMAIFPQVPGFEGRQVVTFHNQRDFVFFRRHRYVFKGIEDQQDKRAQKSEKPKVGLQEIGPRFTLKLRTLQKGTLDTTKGEYEFLHKPAMDKERKTFFL